MCRNLRWAWLGYQDLFLWISSHQSTRLISNSCLSKGQLAISSSTVPNSPTNLKLSENRWSISFWYPPRREDPTFLFLKCSSRPPLWTFLICRYTIFSFQFFYFVLFEGHWFTFVCSKLHAVNGLVAKIIRKYSRKHACICNLKSCIR